MNGMIHKPGDIIADRYRIESYVGAGGMQEVYKATDLLLSRVVALKAPKSSSAEKRFKRSAVLAAKVNHANVAKTLDYIATSTRDYLIEEFIEGCDLAGFLGKHVSRLDPFAASRVLHHLAKGLAASHHVDVVHRDLKPNNVMVVGGATFSGFKLTDFGIAKMAEQEMEDAVDGLNAGQTTSSTAFGALPYMAPEFIEDMKAAGKPSDVWALGAMAYELLTGKRPFGSGYLAVPLIQQAKFPPLDPDILSQQYAPFSRDLFAVISMCMQKDPTLRPSADKLVKICEGLCYSATDRAYGQVVNMGHYPTNFFASPEDGGEDVFLHTDSVYGGSVGIGNRIWFARYPGKPRDRLFPVVIARDLPEDEDLEF